MKEIPLSKGKVAVVDDEDYDLLSQYTWHFSSSGYAVRSVHESGKRVTILMHRSLCYCPADKIVDHVNGDRLDNRKENLRVVSQVENQANRRRVNHNNQTGYKGVSWHKKGQKFEAGVTYLGRRYFLGLFEDPVEAARAYNAKARELFGEYARLNVIPEDSAV